MELIGLECTDLDVERGTLFVREGKGKKDRVVPIGERAIRWTERYLDYVRPRFVERAAHRAVRNRSTTTLFLSARGTKLKPGKLTDRLHEYLRKAGIEKPGSVHIFRHTMATLMHDAGADIRDLQEILGHAQLSTTEIYTHVSIERLKAIHTRTHPAHVAHASADPNDDVSSRVRAPAPFLLAAEVAANEENADAE
jgi:integrase/recombinase XerD